MEQLLYTPKNELNDYKFWMAYPAIKSFALASLGYLWLNKIADETDGVSVEKIYTDTERTQFNPIEVGAIAFSISFDFDFMGVFEVLDKYNIPLKSSDRDENAPLVQHKVNN